MNIQTLGFTGFVVVLVKGVCVKVKAVWPAVAVNSSEVGRIAAEIVIAPDALVMVMAVPGVRFARVNQLPFPISI